MPDFESALRDARAGKLAPVYVLAGEETFLRDQLVAALRQATLEGGLSGFNDDRFTAGDARVDDVLSAARTVPMMASRRFVLLRGVDRWDGGESTEAKEKASPLDRLSEYLSDPSPSTCLVCTATKLDGRRKFTSAAKKSGFFVACDPLDRRSLPRWIEARCRAAGHAIGRDVVEFLAEIAGPELSSVSDAVERLALFVGEGKPITEHAVSECVVRVRSADVWALVDAVGARDLGRALRTLADVYDARDGGLKLLGAVAWSVRQLARYQAAVAGGASPGDAATKAGVYQPFRARELDAKARAIPRREVERWLTVLAETDLALKSSRRGAQAILEEMLTRLVRRG